MTIKDRNLTPGMTLIGKYHKQPYKCQVIAGENGKPKYKLEDGREFKSLSAAGMAITGHPCDGWVFWSVATTENAPAPIAQETINSQTETPKAAETSATEVETHPENPAPVLETVAAKKSVFRTPNQKGVTEGQTRWYCQACGESFQAPYGEVPTACPMGHK